MNVFKHQEVMQALAAGIAEAESRGVVVGISVVDEAANLVGSIIMGGAREAWLCDDSRGKAMATAVFERRRTGTLSETANGPMLTWLNNHYGGRLSYLRGGVPIFRA